MTLSIGIDYGNENWKTSMRERGQTLELCSFEDSAAVLTYLKRTCAIYPEPPILLSLGNSRFEAPFMRLDNITDSYLNEMLYLDAGQAGNNTRQLLIAIRDLNLNSYWVPSIRCLPCIPLHRKLLRSDLGSSKMLCNVATLLYYLQEQEASWTEMRFLCVEVNANSISVVVIEDGSIVNGIGATVGFASQLM